MMILVALLGSLCLLATSSFHGLRGHRPHRSLMSQGVPASVMQADMTAAYAESLCSAQAKPMLLNQSWTDGPMCRFGGSQSFKVHILTSCNLCLIQKNPLGAGHVMTTEFLRVFGSPDYDMVVGQLVPGKIGD